MNQVFLKDNPLNEDYDTTNLFYKTSNNTKKDNPFYKEFEENTDKSNPININSYGYISQYILNSEVNIK